MEIINGVETSEEYIDTEFIPIEWANNGTSSPDVAETVTSTNGNVVVRKFSNAADTDVRIPWKVPFDVVPARGIKYWVSGIITEADVFSAKDLAFGLSGYSITDNEALNGTFGTQVASILTAQTYTQYDQFRTNKSTTVTVTGLGADELAMLYFERTTAGADNYAAKIGVIGIWIEFTRRRRTA